MEDFLETLNNLIDSCDLSIVEIVGALSLAQQRVAFDAFIEADSEALEEEADETDF
jgi:hypothetical protein